MKTIDDVKIIEVPKFLDVRGNLSLVEQNNHIPFEIKCTYWIYNVPFKRNRTTILTGNVFTAGSNVSSITINSDWLDSHNVDF